MTELDIILWLIGLAKYLGPKGSLVVSVIVGLVVFWYVTSNLALRLAPRLKARWPTSRVVAWIEAYGHLGPSHNTTAAVASLRGHKVPDLTQPTSPSPSGKPPSGAQL